MISMVSPEVAGKRFDVESGLYHFHFRQYDPRTGVWTGQDPIGILGGLNLYGYVQNDPVNLMDPLGLVWQYSQSTGEIDYIDPVVGMSYPVDTGYSGYQDGLNNPDMQDVRNTGPIPTGSYEIGSQRDSTNTGRGVMDLNPDTSTETHGRTSFQIHGDNSRGDQSASRGCIVVGRTTRDRIANSGDNRLEVVDGRSDESSNY